ncbi:MAG: 4-hydroxy-tetrahydrodipicolinate synthase [Phycisphaeraceae bacterium]|nr:4-hydroxy-tetrahydrodipicolinate synthase [Phycisphaeraceae bacterium]
MTTPHPTHRRFTGAFTAIITPFNARGDGIDFGRLEQQIRDQAKGGVTGIVVAGTTGESPTLTHHEYEHLVKTCVEHGRAEGIMVIAGTGSNSTSHAVELQRLAAQLGADAALSVNPYYNKPTQEGLYRHFITVADAAELPVVLYNIPGRTGVALTPATVERLSKHPNIRACKEATGSTDSASEIAQRCPDLALLSGDDSMTLPFASVGAVGVVSVISNIVPAKMTALCSAFLGGRWSEALSLHREVFPLCRASFLETNPIPVKAAMKLLGRDNGVLRLPMTEATGETVKTLQAVLTELALL